LALLARTERILTLIAGQAFSKNLILVTANMREFGRVKGLVVEDWMV
jgi:predicted nucleic acid-binding protein